MVMSKREKVLLGVFLLFLFVVIPSLGEWTWECASNCDGGCHCYGSNGWIESGPCCGGCLHEFWYGLDYIDCCDYCEDAPI